jgi:hypothetical protein
MHLQQDVRVPIDPACIICLHRTPLVLNSPASSRFLCRHRSSVLQVSSAGHGIAHVPFDVESQPRQRSKTIITLQPRRTGCFRSCSSGCRKRIHVIIIVMPNQRQREACHSSLATRGSSTLDRPAFHDSVALFKTRLLLLSHLQPVNS